MTSTDHLTARVAVFADRRIDLRQLTLPPRGPGEIDVRIRSAAICGSDLHTVLGHRAAPDDVALGHEGIGVITDLDPGSRDARGVALAIGDRVVLSMISFCGSCDRCRAGLTMKCRALRKYGHDSVARPPYATGMLADHVRLAAGLPVVAVPQSAEDSILVTAGCAGATAAAVVAAASGDPIGRALVFGAGAVGFLCAAMLSTAGYQVLVRDPDADRLALLTGTGARPADGTVTDVPLVVEASGNPQAFADAVDATAVGGMLVAAGAVSPGSSVVPLDPATIVTRRLRLAGVHNYTTADFLTAVDWLLAYGRRLGVDRLTSPARPLDDIDGAFELMRTAQFARVVVSPVPDANR